MAALWLGSQLATQNRLSDDMTTSTSMSDPPSDKGEKVRAMAACMARVFLGNEDGRRVLHYLRERFGVHRVTFVKEAGRYDSTAAALRDGERHVLAEIEAALKTANPGQWAQSFV